MNVFSTDLCQDEFGVIRLEKWPEGLVFWVGGEIKWRSWKDKAAVQTISVKLDGEEVKAWITAAYDRIAKDRQPTPNSTL